MDRTKNGIFLSLILQMGIIKSHRQKIGHGIYYINRSVPVLKDDPERPVLLVFVFVNGLPAIPTRCCRLTVFRMLANRADRKGFHNDFGKSGSSLENRHTFCA